MQLADKIGSTFVIVAVRSHST